MPTSWAPIRNASKCPPCRPKATSTPSCFRVCARRSPPLNSRPLGRVRDGLNFWLVCVVILDWCLFSLPVNLAYPGILLLVVGVLIGELFSGRMMHTRNTAEAIENYLGVYIIGLAYIPSVQTAYSRINALSVMGTQMRGPARCSTTFPSAPRHLLQKSRAWSYSSIFFSMFSVVASSR